MRWYQTACTKKKCSIGVIQPKLSVSLNLAQEASLPHNTHRARQGLIEWREDKRLTSSKIQNADEEGADKPDEKFEQSLASQSGVFACERIDHALSQTIIHRVPALVPPEHLERPHASSMTVSYICLHRKHSSVNTVA